METPIIYDLTAESLHFKHNYLGGYSFSGYAIMDNKMGWNAPSGRRKAMENQYTFYLGDDNLATTTIDNIFINEYMPRARGDYVKVYLYGLKQARSQSHAPVDNVALSQLFNITEGDVISAWDYWKKQGIIDLTYEGTKVAHITFYHIPSVLLKAQNEGAPKAVSVSPPADDDGMGARTAEMFNRIQRMYGSRALPKKDMLAYKKWLSEYGFEPEAVVILVEYALNLINSKSETFTPAQILSYMETIAESWRRQGIHTFTEADAYIVESRNRQRRHYGIFKYLGLRRAPMESERTMMDTWSGEWGFSDEIIKVALGRTSKPNLKYINGILEKWHQAGIKSLADIEAQDAAHRSTSFKGAPKVVDEETAKRLAVYDEMDAEDANWFKKIGENSGK